MRIVVLDGVTLNPGDLSWEPLTEFGQVDVHEGTAPGELLERLDGAEGAIVNKVEMRRDTLAALPDLKYIGVTATGYNIVDTAAAGEHGVTVTNVPTYGTRSVAQMVFAHLLELTQHVGDHSRTVHEGKWSAGASFCYWDHPLIELADLTMGVVGFGRIGQAVADLARAFGMKVIAHDVDRRQIDARQVAFAELDELFAAADVVSLHCPLTPRTEAFVHTERIGRMKRTALLINTSRGQLINEPDLAEALNAGRIAGAGLDVLSVEPPPADNPLLSAKNCFITPHNAWATRSARQRLMTTAVENLRAFVEGRPKNVVN